MTSLEKLEKLKQQQQMQEPPSHLAIEQPQQLPFEELAASDVPVVCKMHLQASGILPVICLSIRSSTETGPAAALSVSHASAQALSAGEEQTVEAAVLHQLEYTVTHVLFGSDVLTTFV
ncbi:unnamed protein product [Sphagnum troendelagicum]|uniref:Uncharacterized protein n=1 Tax=Sphagnum troendelagicum TaxID=128251 RepID=A0ABP0TL61_9BRYO